MTNQPFTEAEWLEIVKRNEAQMRMESQIQVATVGLTHDEMVEVVVAIEGDKEPE